MLLRAVLLLILIILLVRFLIRLGGLTAAALRARAAPPPQPAAVALVPCGRCGVFVPRSLVSAVGDGFLCRSCAGA